MSYRETTERLAGYPREIAALRAKMREVQASVEPEEVTDYLLTDVGRNRGKTRRPAGRNAPRASTITVSMDARSPNGPA